MESQRIMVFGAGGRAGRAVLREARRRDLDVIGVVRDPRRHADLTGIVAGDITAPVDTAGAVVVNAVTPFSAPPTSFDDFDPDYYVRIVDNLTDARRVVEIGLAATLRTTTGRLYEDPAAFPPFLRPFAEARMRGLTAWQHHPEVDWLVLTPPPGLAVDAPATGHYHLGRDTLENVSPLSYADLAVAVVDQVEDPTRHREQVAVHHRER